MPVNAAVELSDPYCGWSRSGVSKAYGSDSASSNSLCRPVIIWANPALHLLWLWKERWKVGTEYKKLYGGRYRPRGLREGDAANETSKRLQTIKFPYRMHCKPP